MPGVIDEVDVLARTVWAEARGEGPEGMVAVANVVCNRVAAGARYRRKWGQPHPLFGDGTFESACKRKWQFSCWNPSDPNLPKLLAVDETDTAFAQAMRIAGDAVAGNLADITGGATHYLTRYARAHADSDHWSRKAEPICEIGDHIFFRNP